MKEIIDKTNKEKYYQDYHISLEEISIETIAITVRSKIEPSAEISREYDNNFIMSCTKGEKEMIIYDLVTELKKIYQLEEYAE